MGKKVIKFNLVGAIFVMLLAISLIVGLVVWVPKIKKQMSKNKEIQQQSQEQESRIEPEKEYKEKVILANGKELECRMIYFKSDYGYAMKYDADLFYVNKVKESPDDYISLYSSTVGILIDKKEGKFDELQQKMDSEADEIMETEKELYDRDASLMEFDGDQYVEKKNDNRDYEGEKERINKIGQKFVERIKINNIEAIKRTMISKEGTLITYAVKKDDNSYYNIEVRCSTEFEKDLLIVMEKMVESFEILIQ
jgi:hypothetical protein